MQTQISKTNSSASAVAISSTSAVAIPSTSTGAISSASTGAISSASAVAIKFLSAVQQRDRDTVISLFHPDVQWSQPGNNLLSGPKNSVTEVMQMGTDMGAIAEQSLLLTHFDILAENGGSVVCLLHWMADTPSGKKLDVDNIDIYEIVDGQIVRSVVYTADQAREDEFWA